MSLKSNPDFVNITFAANGSKGIRILEGTLSSNATLSKRNVAGINNIAYIINNITISSNAIFTIQPGVVIKFPNYYSSITVSGALIANGIPSDKIIFSSLPDVQMAVTRTMTEQGARPVGTGRISTSGVRRPIRLTQ